MRYTKMEVLAMVGALTVRFQKDEGEIDSDKNFGIGVEEKNGVFEIWFCWTTERKPVPPMVNPSDFEGDKQTTDSFVLPPEFDVAELVNLVYGQMREISEWKIIY